MLNISMNYVKSGAWTALVSISAKNGLCSALHVSIDVECRSRRVAGRDFWIGEALRTEKFEAIADIEKWLSQNIGSAGLKWGIIWSVVDQVTEGDNRKFGDFQIS